MLIGVDGAGLQIAGTGIEQYLRELLAALLAAEPSHTYAVHQFWSLHTPARAFPEWGPRVRWVCTPFPTAPMMRMWEAVRWPGLEARIGPVDLFLAANLRVPPLSPKVPVVSIAYDLAPVVVPNQTSVDARRFMADARAQIARARRVLAISRTTAEDVARLFPEAAYKVRLLPWAVSPRFVPAPRAAVPPAAARMGVKPPYLLAVGTFQPRKNYEGLLKAMAAVRSRLGATQLVIAGGKGPQWERTEALRDTLGLQDSVVFLHGLSDDDILGLYQSASGLIQPSWYEGLGLPVVEAMACGLPVATSTAGALGEVAGNAALLFDPADTAAMGDALITLATDSGARIRLIAAGLLRASGAGWDAVARVILSVFEEVSPAH